MAPGYKNQDPRRDEMVAMNRLILAHRYRKSRARLTASLCRVFSLVVTSENSPRNPRTSQVRLLTSFLVEGVYTPSLKWDLWKGRVILSTVFGWSWWDRRRRRTVSWTIGRSSSSGRCKVCSMLGARYLQDSGELTRLASKSREWCWRICRIVWGPKDNK